LQVLLFAGVHQTAVFISPIPLTNPKLELIMRRKLIFGGFLILALTAILNSTMAQTNGGFDIQGKVTTRKPLKKGDSLGAIFVERVKESESKIDKAHVSINEKTLIFIQEGDVQAEAKWSDIKKGDRVAVRFTNDPRIMIYPTRAAAAEVVIFRGNPKEPSKLRNRPN
jgi:hypothetical protein